MQYLLKIVAEKFRAAMHAGTIVRTARTTCATVRFVDRTPADPHLANRNCREIAKREARTTNKNEASGKAFPLASGLKIMLDPRPR
jgi:hypothetical protein